MYSIWKKTFWFEEFLNIKISNILAFPYLDILTLED